MGSEAKSKILVVDLSDENLKPGTSTWIKTSNDIRRAMEDCGGFIANYNKLPLQLHNDFFTAAKELFDLPTETKIKNTSNKPYHDYFGQYTTIPLYESLAIDDPSNLEATQSFTNIMWPAGNDYFCESSHSMAKVLVELYQLTMRIICESYGIDRKCYDSYVESSRYLLRLYKYRVPQQNEASVGLFPHTDKNMLTILHQSSINALKMKTKDDEWIDLDLSPSSFVIMAADMLMAWSNDRLTPCVHRVAMDIAREPRYSLGLHTFNSGIIHVPKELVDDKHPLRYKPFDCYEYLHFYGTDEGKKVNGSIKVYCGI